MSVFVGYECPHARRLTRRNAKKKRDQINILHPWPHDTKVEVTHQQEGLRVNKIVEEATEEGKWNADNVFLKRDEQEWFTRSLIWRCEADHDSTSFRPNFLIKYLNYNVSLLFHVY